MLAVSDVVVIALIGFGTAIVTGVVGPILLAVINHRWQRDAATLAAQLEQLRAAVEEKGVRRGRRH